MNIRKVKLMAVLLVSGVNGLNCSEREHFAFFIGGGDLTGKSSIVQINVGMSIKTLRTELNRQFEQSADNPLTISITRHGLRIFRDENIPLIDENACLTEQHVKDLDAASSRDTNAYVYNARSLRK
jgi:hypothetical protein